MKKLALVAAALALSACATDTSMVRQVMLDQIAAWNAAGVDPVQMDGQRLLYASLACGTLSSISTVLDPTAPALPADLADWCAVALKAAAPAS